MMLASKTVTKVDFIDIKVINNSATLLLNVNDEFNTGMQLCETSIQVYWVMIV